MKTGFIGIGNMGGAILRGYASSSQGEKDRIMICDPNRERSEAVLKEFPRISMTEDILDLVRASEAIVLGVKPQAIDDVLEVMAKAYLPEKLVISMAAGISIAHIRKFLGRDAKIVRIMPNTPALIGEGMIAVCPGDGLSLADLTGVDAILKPTGKTEEVPESMIDCVIGVSGSSPAYTFMYIEALVKAAAANGMPMSMARTFAAQAVMGAAKLVMESPKSLEQLRIDVCSPGGTTIEAVKVLQKNGFEEDVRQAFQAAVDRSKEMTRQKGE